MVEERVPSHRIDDRQRVLALNRIPRLGSATMTRLLEEFGSPAGVCAASVDRLRRVRGVTAELAREIARGGRDAAAAAEELRLAREAGCRVILRREAGYPAPLQAIPDPPVVLYMKGSWTAADRIAVAIVGSRHATVYGQHVAQTLAYDLASLGVTIVSGLARGIDAAAHRGALRAGGRTLAVLGCGLSSVYPQEHEALAADVVARGALISEFAMTMPPLPHHFPRRNRLISGLSLGVVVVEASQRSGALITADCGLEQGREVFAVPGKVDSLTSQGTHHLLKQGARLVTSADDIVQELRLRPVRRTIEKAATESGAGGEALEARLLARSAKAIDLETLAAELRLDMAACASLLLRLELRGLIRALPGKRFISTTSDR